MAPPIRAGGGQASEGSAATCALPQAEDKPRFCRKTPATSGTCGRPATLPTERQSTGESPGSELHSQGLRLPPHARERIARLASELSAAGARVTPGAATRGLCLLALSLARGAAGSAAAEAFRTAASAESKVRGAVAAFVLLLDVAITTKRTPADPEPTPARGGDHRHTPQQSCRGLPNQALRLPRDARDELDALVRELSAPGGEVTPTEAVRGLCLLAVELADGAAGAEVMEAFRIAAADPTPQGTRRAVDALRLLLDGEPSTTPEPPVGDDTVPSTRGGGTIPPPSLPRAA